MSNYLKKNAEEEAACCLLGAPRKVSQLRVFELGHKGRAQVLQVGLWLWKGRISTWVQKCSVH